MSNRTQTNFVVLQQHDPQLLHLGMLAEKYFAEDPNTCILKLRQLAELLAQMLAARTGLYASSEEKQYDLLRRLQESGVLPREVFQIFSEIRRAGNAANHAMSGDHRSALSTLKLTWQLGLWFHRTFKNPDYKSGPFLPPCPPADESAELRAELERLNQAVTDYQSAHQEATQQLENVQSQLREAKDERSFWEQLAAESEQAKVALEQRLVEQQNIAAAQPKSNVTHFINAANTAAKAVQLDEADTRKIIDQQLRQAGWEADSEIIKFNKGARPEKNRNRAIAEWPTESGPADYVLFIGLTPVAVVEAKRKNVDVSGALQQAKRYSRTFKPSAETTLPEENWGNDDSYRVPFAFSANGRPFLRQLSTKSGSVAYFKSNSVGSTMVNLNQKIIKSLSFHYPSSKEQHEIVRRVQSLFAYADRLEARYNTARAQVEKLTPALLAKAFRGELVPQDPNDEPASELLARIAAARCTDKPAKARKSSRGKTAYEEVL